MPAVTRTRRKCTFARITCPVADQKRNVDVEIGSGVLTRATRGRWHPVGREVAERLPGAEPRSR